jgi:hypothetical protein
LVGEAYRLLRAGETDDHAFARIAAHWQPFVAPAAAIAEIVYNALPAAFRSPWMLKEFATEAIQMLEEGKTEKEVFTIIWDWYATEFETGYNEEKVFVHRIPHRPAGIRITATPRHSAVAHTRPPAIAASYNIISHHMVSPLYLPPATHSKPPPPVQILSLS